MSREKADKEEKKGFKREALSWVICIVVTILLTEFILNFVIINCQYSKWFDGEYDHDE